MFIYLFNVFLRCFARRFQLPKLLYLDKIHNIGFDGLIRPTIFNPIQRFYLPLPCGQVTSFLFYIS